MVETPLDLSNTSEVMSLSDVRLDAIRILTGKKPAPSLFPSPEMDPRRDRLKLSKQLSLQLSRPKIPHITLRAAQKNKIRVSIGT